MCGRFALHAPPAEIIRHFGLDDCVDFAPRYNIPPGTATPVIRQSPQGERLGQLLRWGLVPYWAKDPLIGNRLSNARSESIGEKPAFRAAFARRRCLIPASGFFEWQTAGKQKLPHYIHLQSAAPLALGGLWESWQAADGSLLRSFCVITTAPNELMAPIHDRMPVIIAPEHFAAWLDPQLPGQALSDLLRPCSAAAMTAWPVSKAVSRTANDGPELIAALPA